jgi:hypothetical protein
MADTRKGNPVNGREGPGSQVPTAGEVASRGLASTRDIFALGGSLINDMLGGDRKAKKLAGPVCRTGNMMLRAVDLEQTHNDGESIEMR